MYYTRIAHELLIMPLHPWSFPKHELPERAGRPPSGALRESFDDPAITPFPSPAAARVAPPASEQEIARAAVRLWVHLLIAGLLLLAAMAVGGSYLGLFASTAGEQSRLAAAQDDIVHEVRKVRDAAAAALPQIAANTLEVKQDTARLARMLADVAELETRLRAQTAQARQLLEQAPLTPGAIWALSDKPLKGLFLLIGLCLAVLLFDVALRIAGHIRQLP